MLLFIHVIYHKESGTRCLRLSRRAHPHPAHEARHLTPPRRGHRRCGRARVQADKERAQPQWSIPWRTPRARRTTTRAAPARAVRAVTPVQSLRRRRPRAHVIMRAVAGRREEWMGCRRTKSRRAAMRGSSVRGTAPGAARERQNVRSSGGDGAMRRSRFRGVYGNACSRVHGVHLRGPATRRGGSSVPRTQAPRARRVPPVTAKMPAAPTTSSGGGTTRQRAPTPPPETHARQEKARQ
jgi:hypothetical protein